MKEMKPINVYQYRIRIIYRAKTKITVFSIKYSIVKNYFAKYIFQSI